MSNDILLENNRLLSEGNKILSEFNNLYRSYLDQIYSIIIMVVKEVKGVEKRKRKEKGGKEKEDNRGKSIKRQ